MRELPILFSTEMVKAILDDRKKVTRRVINPQPPSNITGSITRWENQPRGWFAFQGNKELWPYRSWGMPEPKIKQPYHRGDLLYVRENWWDLGYMEDGKWDGRLESHTVKPRYVATCPDPFAKGLGGVRQPVRIPWRESQLGRSTWRKRPSIHMPKWASRIWLEVLNVRAERLQEISLEDCYAEGIVSQFSANYKNKENISIMPLKKRFKMLWNSLNTKRGYSWEANPWVWRYEFKRIQK